MKYYRVWVASQRYRGREPLTYSSPDELRPGQVVRVPLQRQTVSGIIAEKTSKPDFATKPINSILTAESLPLELIKLTEWLRVYYPAPSGQLISLLLPAALHQKSRGTIEIAPQNTGVAPLPELTVEQQAAVRTIAAAEATTILLHGDTGTGKTRIYIELALNSVANGKSVIILTPEIGLTPQLISSFNDVFPGRVTTVHSHLTPAQRRDTWLKILRDKEAQVIIGPRSALFSPVRDLGLVVIDEAHDHAYKQEQSPYYQTSRVAAALSSLHDATLILGTATPPVTDYFAVSEKKLPIVRMTQPAVDEAMTDVLIDFVKLGDPDLFTRSPWLSNTLIEKIEIGLRHKEQSLIFLNRRGTARLVLCQNCGWQALCPRCDLPLTYHGDSHSMRCHTCGFYESALTNCPDCGEADIIFRSIGTKSIVTELQKLFPKARIQRFDSDSIKSERLELHYDAVKKGDIDILVGTQMLTKGLDLPKLSLVGAVAADTSLYFPDYTAEERTFQMLSQVIGRVGRGHVEGSVVIQTYHPGSPAIQAAITKNYTEFYESQLRERSLYGFPPFRYLLKLTCSRKSHASAKKACEKLAGELAHAKLRIEIVGPSPAFQEKSNDMYHWQIIIKAVQRAPLLKVIEKMPANWSYDIDPSHLL